VAAVLALPLHPCGLEAVFADGAAYRESHFLAIAQRSSSNTVNALLLLSSITFRTDKLRAFVESKKCWAMIFS
jgi:hypothetical protein